MPPSTRPTTPPFDASGAASVDASGDASAPVTSTIVRGAPAQATRLSGEVADEAQRAPIWPLTLGLRWVEPLVGPASTACGRRAGVSGR